jgi:hypothetical protein
MHSSDIDKREDVGNRWEESAARKRDRINTFDSCPKDHFPF